MGSFIFQPFFQRIWQIKVWFAALLLVLPVLALVYEASLPSDDIFTQLWDTVLTDYIINSVIMVLLVGLLMEPVFWFACGVVGGDVSVSWSQVAAMGADVTPCDAFLFDCLCVYGFI